MGKVFQNRLRDIVSTAFQATTALIEKRFNKGSLEYVCFKAHLAALGWRKADGDPFRHSNALSVFFFSSRLCSKLEGIVVKGLAF